MDWEIVQERMNSLNFSTMIKKHIKINRKEALNIPKMLDRIFINYNVITNINYKIISNLIPLTLEEMGYLLSLCVFISIEGPLITLIDILVFYLMFDSHHDIWSEFKQDYIRKYDDVQQIPYYQKIKFLNHHNFSFIEELSSREFRNAIAHQNYSIDKEGNVLIYKKSRISKKISMEEMNIKLKNIYMFLCLFTKSFWLSIPKEERDNLPIPDEVKKELDFICEINTSERDIFIPWNPHGHLLAAEI